MNQGRILIDKLFDDNSIIKGDTKLYINNDEDRNRFCYGSTALLRELLDIAVFCAVGGEDFREYSFSVGEYEERTTILFKGGVGSSNPYYMNVDYISEKYIKYDEDKGLNHSDIFTGFYYIDTLSLVKNLLELLDRSYKAYENCIKQMNGKNWKKYVIENWSDVKKDLAWDMSNGTGKEDWEIEVEMNDENLKKAKEIMTFDERYFDNKTVEEIAEKKCYIIKQLWFRYKNDKRYKDFPKYVNNLEPIVDLHANDEGKYPHMGTNFVFIGDGDQHIEI